jgi:predicted transcriptional regulator YdeE
MECKKVKKIFKIVAQRGNGAFTNFGTEVPKAAQQFLVRVDEIENSSGTEVAIFEPKKDENHLEGNFYVGMVVNQTVTETPTGMNYIELNQDYVTTRGNINNIGSLHNQLLKWTDNEGFKRNLEDYIVETYHPLENGDEEVEIYLPIHT